MNKKYVVSALAAAVIALAGCAGGGVSQGDGAAVVPSSGFLSDYSKLRPVDGVDGTYRYIDTTANLRAYTKVMIDPVQVFLTPNPDYKGMQPDAMKRMTDAFRMEFVGALASGYQVVNQPGPDVLRVRIAITGVQPTSPALGVTDFIPIKALFNVARDASGNAPQVAEMSAEVEVLNPAGRVVGAAVSTRKADKTLPQGESITWADLQSIAASWGKGMRQNLDRMRSPAGQ
ncbi:MAG: DUF3313 domain-containing protein [Rhodocyclaceae bacterium]|nr:DUF3313 domain-containing protein [Rhodocyclaceae bacterium]HNJ77261.1 DUF3313 domain-containing protein [Azospira sp.]HNN46608.1 DUF3313 domain-containing protein [Azospira sp.]